MQKGGKHKTAMYQNQESQGLFLLLWHVFMLCQPDEIGLSHSFYSFRTLIQKHPKDGYRK